MLNRIYKSKVFDVWFIVILTAVFCLPLFNGSLNAGFDIEFHITRIKNICDALRTHTFPIYIYPYANNGFGYGSPMFYCDLFLLPSVLLYLVGVPVIIVWKITLFFYALIAGITIFHLSKIVFKENRIIQIACTILYMFSNVRVYYYYFGCGLGNIIALSFLPLLMLAFYKFFVFKENCWRLLGISFSLILLSHLLTFTIGVIFFAIFLMIDIRNTDRQRIICLIKAAILAMTLSAWFLFPLIEQLLSQKFWSSFLNNTTNMRYFKESQRTLIQVFSDCIFDESPTVQHLGIIYSIGAILLYAVYKIKNRFRNTEIDILTIVLVAGIVLLTDLLPLYKISILRQFQFIDRINIYLTPISVYIIGKVLSEMQHKEIIISIILAYLIFNVSYVYRFLNKEENGYSNNSVYEEIIEGGLSILGDTHGFNMYEIGQGEYLPYTNSYDYYHANSNIEFANEESAVWDYERIGTTITFTTNYDYSDYIYMPLSWYKGYYCQELDEDGNVLYEKECTYNEYTKRVGMYMEEGTHTYKVYYKGTVIQHISLIISIISFVILGFVQIKHLKEKC